MSTKSRRRYKGILAVLLVAVMMLSSFGSAFAATDGDSNVSSYSVSAAGDCYVNLDTLTYQLSGGSAQVITQYSDVNTFLTYYNAGTLPEIYITTFVFNGVDAAQKISKDDTTGEVTAKIITTTFININMTGSIVFTGTATDTAIGVNTNNVSGNINIILNGVNITSTSSTPAIMVYNKDITYTGCKVTIKTVSDTYNYLNGGKLKKTSTMSSDKVNQYTSASSIYSDTSDGYYYVYTADEVSKILFASETADSEDISDGDPYTFYKLSGAVGSDIDLYFEGYGYLEINSLGDEGVETKGDINFTGGTGDYKITSYDDALNASTSGTDIYINVNSLVASVNTDADEGDGIDSNGTIHVEGGTICAFAHPTSGDDGIDSDNGTYLNGGNVIATGNMSVTASNNSAQDFMGLTFSSQQAAGTVVCITDTTGAPLAAFKSGRTFTTLLYSSPLLTKSTYYVYKNGTVSGTGVSGFYTDNVTHTGGTQQQYSGTGSQGGQMGGRPGQQGGNSSSSGGSYQFTITSSQHTFSGVSDYQGTAVETTAAATQAQTTQATTQTPVSTEAATQATTSSAGVTGGYDLIVTDIAWGNTAISAGTAVAWTVTVKNNGDADIPSGTIIGYQVQVDGSTAVITWCDSYSGGLKSGESVELTTNGGTSGNTWTATNGTHSVMAWVDDVNRFPNEVNENNNQYTISLTVPYVPVVETAAPTTATPTTAAPTTAAPTTEAPTQAPSSDACPTVHIEAEDFASQSGIEIASKVYEGSQFINSIGNGDSATYNVELLGTGNYTIALRASTTYTGYRAVEVYVDGEYKTTVTISSTGAWATFNTFESEELYLTKGSHSVTLKAVGGGYNINWIEFIGNESEEETQPGDDSDVTIHIEAENYDSMSGVALRGTYDQGTDVLKSVDAGDWMIYTVNIESAGNYAFVARAARVDGGTSVLSLIEDGKTIASINVGTTGSWSTFAEFTGTSAYLTAGTHTLKVYADGGRYNLNWFELVKGAGSSVETTTAAPTEAPTEAPTQAPVAGDSIHIEAENYDSMSGVALRGTYDQGTDVLKSVDAGDWMIYTVNVATAGTYRFDVRAARVDAGTSVLSLMENDSVIATVNVGATGSWSTFSEFYGTEVYLSAGSHTFKVYADGGRYNLNWFELTNLAAGEEESTETPVAGESVHIEAEEYTSMSGVALRGTYDQGTDVLSSVDAGDYMIYSVKIPASGIYRFDVRAARSDAGSSLLSLLENDTVIATVSVACTGGWSTFAEFEGTQVYLTAGNHTFMVYANGGRYNINWFELTNISVDSEQPSTEEVTTEEATTEEVGKDNFVEFEGEEETEASTESPTEETTVYVPTYTGGYDLVVTDISWDSSSAVAGSQIVFTATVMNDGDTDIPAGTIIGFQIQVDGNTRSITWCDSYSGGLKAGESIELTCNGGTNGNYWTATSGTHSVMAWIDDVNRLISEVDENNNQYTETIIIN